MDDCELTDLYQYYQKTEPTVRNIRKEIFRLAREAPDLETMHWYMSLDECFENDAFDPSGFSRLRYRCWVLTRKKEPIGRLLNLITPILQEAELVGLDGSITKEAECPTNI